MAGRGCVTIQPMQRPGRKGWYVRIRAGRRKATWEKAGATLEEAEQYADGRQGSLARHIREGAYAPSRVLTVAGLLDYHRLYLAGQKVSQDHLDKSAWAYAKILGYFKAGVPAAAISSLAILKFGKHLRDVAGLSPSSVRGVLVVLRASLWRAWRDKAIPTMPDVEIPSMATRVVRVTDEELGTLWAAADPRTEAGLLLALAMGTGMREKDILGLDWRDFDWEAGTITFWMAKRRADNPKLHTIAMFSPLPEVLARVKKDQGPLFQNRGYRRTASIRRMTARLLGTDEAPHRGYGSHAFRHTLGTRLGELEVPLQDIKEVLGHDSVKTTLKYVHPSNGVAARVRDRVESSKASASGH